MTHIVLRILYELHNASPWESLVKKTPDLLTRPLPLKEKHCECCPVSQFKGRHPQKKLLLSGIARTCWALFYQVIVPKMAICYSNFTIIVCFQNYHHYYHNYHCNHHYHHRNFFQLYAQNIFFYVRKKRTKSSLAESPFGVL